MATEILDLLNRAGTGMARAVGSSETVIFTCPASTTATIKKACITNYSAADVTLKVWHIESGTTTGNGSLLMGTETIPAYSSVWIDFAAILRNLGTADTLIAQCSVASALNISLYGAKVA
jgi:hypothetical protein